MSLEKTNNTIQSDDKPFLDDITVETVSKSINLLYEDFSQNLSQQQIDLANELLNKVSRTVCNFIMEYVDVHYQLYNSNDTYKNFVNNILDDKDYKKLLKIGHTSKRLNVLSAIRSLGISALLRKTTKCDNKSITKTINTWLENCKIVMYTFNSCQENSADFPAMFFATLTVQEILIDEISSKINSM